MGYQVILPAGASHADDELLAGTGISNKAFLPVGGRPMLAYVLDALAASGCVDGVRIIGLREIEVADLVPDGLSVQCLPEHGSMIANVLAGIQGLARDKLVIFCTADIPLLTPEAVCDLVQRAEASGAEACYSVVERNDMEARYPNSGRSFRPLVEGDFCGGDISMFTPRLALEHADFARSLTSERKNLWGLARAIGPGIMVRLLVRRLRIIDLERRLGRILGAPVRAIVTSYAEIGMDVDRPAHLQVVMRAMAANDEA